MEPSAHVDTFARDCLPPQDQWPELLLDTPDVAYPARFNCASELLDRTIEAGHGERVAIWSDVDGKPHATTYGERRRSSTAPHTCSSTRWACSRATACCCAA